MPGPAAIEQQPAIYSILWACMSSWYFGYHLAELNFPVASLTCLTPVHAPRSRLPICLEIDAFRYSTVTALYTAGGLVGSLASAWVVYKEGIKGGIVWTGYLNLVGVFLMGWSWNWGMLGLGRFVAGLSAGLAFCLIPPFLSLVARSSPQLSARSGQIGVIHQLAIVIGVFMAQVAGWLITGSKGDTPGNWRFVVAISGVASLGQIWAATKVFIPPEATIKAAVAGSATPAPAREDTSLLLQHTTETETSASEPLLAGTAPTPFSPITSAQTSTVTPQLPLRELLSNTSLRGTTMLCATVISFQALSGVNAVMFYSTPVLKTLLPNSAGMIGIGIATVNALMTLPAVFLVDVIGKKNLLLFSVISMSITSAALAHGLNSHSPNLSAFAIIGFIASFAVGLGPIPFLLIPDLVPAQAIPALSSLAFALNWTLNIMIALLFLPLRNLLSSPTDPSDPMATARTNEGNVFYVFMATSAILALVVWRGLPNAPGSGMGPGGAVAGLGIGRV
ncbi:general substrate transporter [Dioszegia hungarica]|uniref:General substrate transporter n=1 Tax=Dioszegia hungarica TaxID=4972 RepID=A0AA38H0B6_9TREE|nr:general substrate transporter [Dioszegia hungarica]KAI9631883.1 general substrate transporter [Dioszegia hungarica]